MIARLWSLSALAAELGRDRRSLARDLEGLAPDEETTVGGRVHRRYLMRRAVEHLYASSDALDLNGERAALARAQREKLERQAAIEQRRLIPRTEVVETVGGYIDACRARLLLLPARTAAELDQETGRRVEPIARRILYEAITELREYVPPESARGSRDGT